MALSWCSRIAAVRCPACSYKLFTQGGILAGKTRHAMRRTWGIQDAEAFRHSKEVTMARANALPKHL
jgi:hypothetical protein